MHTSMRSQDLWLGFPHDLFAATVLLEMVAGWVGAEAGEYHHHVDSLHLYADDLPAARRAAATAAEPAEELPALAVPWPRFDRLIGQVTAGAPVPEPGWRELSLLVVSYHAWKDGRRHDARRMLAEHAGVLPRALDRWYDRLASRAEPQSAVAPAGR